LIGDLRLRHRNLRDRSSPGERAPIFGAGTF